MKPIWLIPVTVFFITGAVSANQNIFQGTDAGLAAHRSLNGEGTDASEGTDARKISPAEDSLTPTLALANKSQPYLENAAGQKLRHGQEAINYSFDLLEYTGEVLASEIGHRYRVSCTLRNRDGKKSPWNTTICAKSKFDAKKRANRKCEKDKCNKGQYGFNCCDCMGDKHTRDTGISCKL